MSIVVPLVSYVNSAKPMRQTYHHIYCVLNIDINIAIDIYVAAVLLTGVFICIWVNAENGDATSSSS